MRTPCRRVPYRSCVRCHRRWWTRLIARILANPQENGNIQSVRYAISCACSKLPVSSPASRQSNSLYVIPSRFGAACPRLSRRGPGRQKREDRQHDERLSISWIRPKNPVTRTNRSFGSREAGPLPQAGAGPLCPPFVVEHPAVEVGRGGRHRRNIVAKFVDELQGKDVSMGKGMITRSSTNASPSWPSGSCKFCISRIALAVSSRPQHFHSSSPENGSALRLRQSRISSIDTGRPSLKQVATAPVTWGERHRGAGARRKQAFLTSRTAWNRSGGHDVHARSQQFRLVTALVASRTATAERRHRSAGYISVVRTHRNHHRRSRDRAQRIQVGCDCRVKPRLRSRTRQILSIQA